VLVRGKERRSGKPVRSRGLRAMCHTPGSHFVLAQCWPNAGRGLVQRNKDATKVRASSLLDERGWGPKCALALEVRE